MVAHSVKVVKYGLWLVLERYHVFSHVKALGWERHYIVDFLLLADLCVRQVEKAATAGLAGLKAFELQDKNFRRFI